MAERQQRVQVVREGETVTINFENAGWKPTTVTLTTECGIVEVKAEQDDIGLKAQLVNLRRS